jgi:TonB-linked SusC/RagA family outer membrane protein
MLPFLASAQITLKGRVISSDDNQPLPGVGVTIKGSTSGTQTDVNGNFSLQANAGQVIVFSAVGYVSKQITVGTVTNLRIILDVNSKQLQGVTVVTGALGVKRQAKELGFAATNISSKSLTEAHPSNFTNGLTAKVAGLVLSTVDNGINPQTRFTLRGNRHIIGNNFALVVLNGVPISPNEVNNINPDDIADVNILNGAGAAALYGSEASNGAIIITTKKGTATGAPTINYSNNYQIEQISYFWPLQTQFGSYGGEAGTYIDPYTQYITGNVPFENQSYGPPYTGLPTQLGIPTQDGVKQIVPYATRPTDPRLAFFNIGHQDQNNLTYSSGDDKNSFSVSASYINKTGVVPNDKYQRATLRVSATKTYGIFKADVTAGYTHGLTSTYGGGYGGSGVDGGSSLLSTLVNTPSWVPLTSYKNINAPFADVNTYYNSYGQNPYWAINNSRYNTVNDNFNGSFFGTLTPTKWFDANYRLATNFGTGVQTYTRAQVDFSAYAHSDPTGGYGTDATGTLGSTANTPGSVPGQIANNTVFGDGSITTGGAGPQGFSRLQQDIIVNFHKTFFHDFKANLLLGNTIWEEKLSAIGNSSSALAIEGFYNIGSILGVPTTYAVSYTMRQYAYFGALNLGYKDFAFVEGTIRNDNDSRLSKQFASFWYPSVKGSLILSQALPALKDSKFISYAKLRGSYSKVGDINVSAFSIASVFNNASGFPYGNTGGLSQSTTLGNPNLKPEFTKELEVGGDFSFWESRINTNITYYHNTTTNQTLPISTSPTIGYTSTLVNVGEVDNSGWEFKLDVDALTKAKNKVGVNLGANFAIQNTLVKSLVNGLQQINLGGYSNAAVEAVVGQPYPVLLGTDVNRDPNGHVIVDATGNPSLNSNLVNLGRTTPHYIIGLTQTVSWNIITLTAVSEFRLGAVIYNQGLASATAAGSSQFSASTGRQPFIFPNSVIKNADGTYSPNTSYLTSAGDINFFDNGGYYSAASTYVSSADFWKLREVSLNFDLSKFVKASKFIKRANFALTGRNLLTVVPNATNKWGDPEFNFTTGNAIGVTSVQLPPTRIFGASLNITF